MKIIPRERVNVKRFIIPLILLLLAAFQNSLFMNIRLFGVGPDLVTAFVIGLTLIIGNPWGTFAGLLGGIILDVFSGGAFGSQSLACMVTAYLIGTIEGKIYKDNIFIPGIFTALGTFIKEIIVYVFLYLTRANAGVSYYIRAIILPQMLYNTLLTVLLYRYVVKLAVKLSINKPGGFNA